jgi:hypothetical protein
MVYKNLFAWKSKPKILIDVHTGALSTPWSKHVSKLIMKHASFNIVINQEQQNHLIQNYQIRPVVLEDPIPEFTDFISSTREQEKYRIDQKSNFTIAVISTYAYDEPLEAVLEAASDLSNVYFYVTGDTKNANKQLLIKKSDNVIITGFLDYATYLDLLQKVDVIMDLTTDEKSMVAGGYEAVALEQPLITSDWLPLRRYFNKGTVHINNSSDDIRKAIMVCMTKKQELSEEMRELKIDRMKEWKEKISNYQYLFN